MKQVHSAHTRKVCLVFIYRTAQHLLLELQQISRFVNIVWQSALPPTICAICLSGLYIQSSRTPEVSASHFCLCLGFLGRVIHQSELIGTADANYRFLVLRLHLGIG